MQENETSIEKLLANSWNVFTKVWLKYIFLYAIMLFGSVGIIAITLGQVFTRNIIIENGQTNITPDLIIKSWPFLVIAFLLLIVFAAIVSLMMGKLVYNQAEGKDERFTELLEYSLKNFAIYFVVSLSVGLLTLLGFILFIIPGIYLAVTFSFVSVVFIVENKNSFEAIKRSRELVRGRFWFVFSRLIVLFLISLAVSAISNFIPGSEVISMVANTVIGPISIAYTYFVYKDLVSMQQAK